MYERNRKYIHKYNANIDDALQQLNANSFQIMQSSKQTKYIEGAIGTERITIHSLYNPEREAASIIQSYQTELEKYDYILCVGAGLGYHIKYLQEKYPYKHIYIYEPCIEIFSLFLQELDVSVLDGIYVGTVEMNIGRIRKELFPKKPLLLTLPVYEKIYPMACQKISEEQLAFLKLKEMEMVVYAKNGIKWVYNGIHNHQALKNTPSILHPIFKDYFSQKPVILVSAGPSLDEEIENLREIREKGLAYICSVGSAIRTLVQHNVYPHVACSHDSGYTGMKVYAPIIEQGITEIPFLFGSTVPDDLLGVYPGKKAHFVIHQDRLNAFLLEEEIVYDAATVATVLLQIFFKWNVPRIILVGQNLSFKGNTVYASGIEYYDEFNKQGTNIKDLESVISVDGELIYATLTHKKMRENMESYIHIYGQNTEIINATRGGAQIRGTSFMPLEVVIDKYLTEHAVDEKWFEFLCSKISNEEIEIQRQCIEKNISRLKLFKENFQTNLLEVEKLLESMLQALENKDFEKVSKIFKRYDKKEQQMRENTYYNILIVPFAEMVLQEKEEQLQLIQESKQVEQLRMEQKLQIVKEKFELISTINRWINQEMEELDFLHKREK